MRKVTLKLSSFCAIWLAGIMKIAIWDLKKHMAKIEDIDMEHILPISVINTPTHHNRNKRKTSRYWKHHTKHMAQVYRDSIG